MFYLRAVAVQYRQFGLQRVQSLQCLQCLAGPSPDNRPLTHSPVSASEDRMDKPLNHRPQAVVQSSVVSTVGAAEGGLWTV